MSKILRIINTAKEREGEKRMRREKLGNRGGRTNSRRNETKSAVDEEN